MSRAKVPSVDPSNLSTAQLIALAQSRKPALRPKPNAVPVVHGASDAAPAPAVGITPTDRARKAVQNALRHVSHAELVSLVAEVAPAASSTTSKPPASSATPEPKSTTSPAASSSGAPETTPTAPAGAPVA